jgi:hypothetical protein
MADPVSKCDCHLPTDPPDDGSEWWQPTVDDDPGPLFLPGRAGILSGHVGAVPGWVGRWSGPEVGTCYGR